MHLLKRFYFKLSIMNSTYTEAQSGQVPTSCILPLYLFLFIIIYFRCFPPILEAKFCISTAKKNLLLTYLIIVRNESTGIL